jgi:hypothetical protein
MDCRAHHGEFEGTILDGVLVDGLRTTHPVFLRAVRLRHVVLRGRIGAVGFHPLPFSLRRPIVPGLWLDAARRFYAGVDWALDISEGSFNDLDLRPGAVPTALVRRDPETQVVVTRGRLHGFALDEVDFLGTTWRLPLEWLLESDAEDVILAMPRGERRKYVDVLTQLRDAGLVEPG